MRVWIVCITLPMSSRALLRELEGAGWRVVRVRGSHHVMRHPVRHGTVVVPHPRKELGTGLVRSIRRAAGLEP